MNQPKYILCHHSVTPRDLDKDKTEASINANHKERFKDPKTGVNNYKSSMGWYIGYHYIIYGDGTVRQYRADTDVGVHCKESNMNFQSIAVCMTGDFSHETKDRLNEMPSSAQLLALEKLVRAYQAKYAIPDANVAPHRRYALNPATGKPYKDCYGDNLPDSPTSLFEPKVMEQTDLEWAKTNLPEADWDKPTFTNSDVATALRALAKRVEWRK